MIKIESWSLIGDLDPYKAPEVQRAYLKGRVYGHPNFEDGKIIHSSYIVNLKIKEGFAETHSGNKYFLGRPSTNWMAWLEKTSNKKYLKDLKALCSHLPN